MAVLLALAVSALIAARLAMPGLLRLAANHFLPGVLRAPFSLQGLGFELLAGRVELVGLRVGQPPGFGPGWAIAADRACFEVDLESLRRPPIRVRNVALDGGGFRLAAGPGGRFNTSVLFGGADAEGAGDADTNAAVFPAIVIERATLTNGFFAYADYSDPARPSEARSGGISGVVTNLVIAPESERGQWGRGRVRVAGRLAQAPRPGAHVEAECEVEAFGGYIPRIKGAIHAAGLDLGALEGVFGLDLTEGIRDDPVTFHADVELSPEAIQGSASLDAGGGMAPGSVGLARWEWDAGAGLVRDLRVMQPEDYGGGMMVTASEIRVRMCMTNDGGAWTRVEELLVNGLEASLLVDADGRLNAAALFTGRSGADPASAPAQPEEGGLLFGLVAFSNVAVTLRAMDDAAGPPDMRFDSVSLDCTNIAFGAGPRPPGFGGGAFSMNVGIADFQPMPVMARLDSGAGQAPGPLLRVSIEVPRLDMSAMEPWAPFGFLEAISGTEAGLSAHGSMDRNGINAGAVVRNAAGEPVLVAERLRCGWGFDAFDAGPVRVRQPIGCGTGWMLNAGSAEMRLKRAGAPGGPARISLLRIEDAEATLLLMEDGSLSVESLAVPGPGCDQASAPPGAEPESSAGLLFDEIELRDAALNLRNAGGGGLDLRVERVGAQASGLMIGAKARALPCRIRAGGVLRQPGRATAPFQVEAAMGPVAGGFPPVEAGLLVRDFEPASFLSESRANALPPLFREPLSIEGRAALGATVVDGAFSVKTEAGSALISLDRILLDWSRGDMLIENLRMAHAQSFGSELLLFVPEARVRVESGSLFEPPAVVEYAVARGADVRLIRGARGLFNLEGWMPDAAPGPDAAAPPRAAAPAPVAIRRLELEGGAFTYADYSDGWNPFILRLSGLGAIATNVILADIPGGEVAGPGGLALHARLEQRPHPDALFGLRARFGALGGGIPRADAEAALAGLYVNAIAATARESIPDVFWGAPVTLECAAASAADSIGISLRAGTGGGREIADLERLELELDGGEPTGRLRLRNLRVFQPEGFGGGLLLSVAGAEAFCAPASISSPPLDIRYARVERPELNVVIRSNGVANTGAFFPGPGSGGDAGRPAAQAGGALPILLRELSVSGASLRLRDDTPRGAPLDLEFADIIIEATNLLANASRLDEAAPGALRATASLRQPGRRDALLGACARTAPLVRMRPAFNASARVGCLELKTIQALLPSGAALLVGGDALDISADLRVAPDALEGRIGSEIIGGNSLPLLRIGGTPSAPEMDRSHILFSIGARLGGQVGGALKNTFRLGTGLGQTAHDTTSELRHGAGNIVRNIGYGLRDTVRGAAGADAGGVASGLVAATAGTISTTFSAARKAGERIVDGALGAAAVNQRAADQWRDETPARWARKWEEALSLVESAPLPGER